LRVHKNASSSDSAKKAHFHNLNDRKIKYSERAVVREFDANLTRAYAERVAWDDIVTEWADLYGADRHDAGKKLIGRRSKPVIPNPDD
jgi:hypothetical protein